VRTGDVLIGLHNGVAADDYGLSGTGKQVLAVIEGAGEPLEPGIIAERLIITSGSMTSLLDTLEKRGFVRRLPHPTDRRKLLVDITPEAERILDEMLPAFHQRERRIMSTLTKGEQRQLLELLTRVQVAAAADKEVPLARAERRKPERLRRP
jgi:DNA-binding MarR family transcriptional regulator